MKGVIDTVFNPLLNWLNGIFNSIMNLSVPLSHPLNLSKYLGLFSYLGPTWTSFVTTACALGFIYLVAYLIVAQRGLLIKFKDMIKWW